MSETNDAETVDCVVVGAGPAGVMLSLLLARQGVRVALLEEHADFDRDFRGDTIHPSTLEALDDIGLADEVLSLPHARMRELAFGTPEGVVHLAAFRLLRSKFPYIAVMPQARFLERLVQEARRSDGFRLVMGARVNALIEEDGVVRGVRYRSPDGDREMRARLVVAADGRFSKMRQLSGLPFKRDAVPIDVLWFRIPRPEKEGEGLEMHVGSGHMAVMLERPGAWQVGYILVKGGYKELRQGGIEALRANVAALVPALADRVDAIGDWKDVSLLSVEAGRVERWHKPGLLLIGDAAHVMSPVGGVGINYAVQDAIAAANLLTDKLRAGGPTDADLAAVQARREWPVRVVQAAQDRVARAIAARSLTGEPLRVPWIARFGPVERLMARMIAYGARPERVEERLRTPRAVEPSG